MSDARPDLELLDELLSGASIQPPSKADSRRYARAAAHGPSRFARWQRALRRVFTGIVVVGVVAPAPIAWYASDRDDTVEVLPAPVMPEADDVAVGGTTCEIRLGEVWCYGDEQYGATGGLDSRDQAPRAEAVRVAGPRDVVEVDVAQYYACARTSDGDVWCWGRVPGATETLDDPTLIEPTLLEGIGPAVDLSAATNRVCVVAASGSVFCAGNAVLGDVAPGQRDEWSFRRWTFEDPRQVHDVSDAIEIVGEEYWSCARRSSGVVLCWGGTNGIGLEYEGATRVELPAPAASLSGGRFPCALLATSDVWCWGSGSHRQFILPDNWPAPYDYGPWGAAGETRPYQVPLSGPVVHMAQSYHHACAVIDDGSVSCWGEGFARQADGSSLVQPLPAGPVAGVTGAEAVILGNHADCAIATNAAPVCWSAHNSAQGADPALRLQNALDITAQPQDE